MHNINLGNLRYLQLFLKTILAFAILFLVSAACSKKSSSPTPPPPPPVVITVPPININSTSAKEIIADMGGGFNLGNVFDYGLNTTAPATNKAIVDLYYSAGMRHVRIPVTWMDGFSSNLADANGNIDFLHPRFLELREIIDYALAKKMYVVLNTHHEHWLKNHYDGTAAYDTKFSKLWHGIATYFKDYPKQLIFDVLNEPEGTMGQWAGTGFPQPTNATAIELTRKINKVGYDAIRATGGANATRIIMVEPNGQGNQGMIEAVYPTKASLPGGGADTYLALQVHTYDPWAFCGQTGTNAAYPGNTTIETGIKKVGQHSVLLDVPVNYGEFGVGRQNNTAERNTDIVRSYYRIIKQTCKAEKMSFTTWDDRGWFGLITGSGTSFNFTNNIVPYMMAQ